MPEPKFEGEVGNNLENRQQNVDLLEEQLNIEEKELLERSRGGLEKLFDSTKTAQEKKDKILPYFQPLFDVHLLDEALVLSEIEDCCAIEERDFFVQKALDLTKILILTKRKDTNGVLRKARLKAQGREDVNGLLDYELCDNGKVIKIHMQPDEKPGLIKLKKLVDSGLRDLAKIVKGNLDVEKIELWSWIVHKYKDRIKDLGFNLLEEEYVTGEGKKGNGAEISREEFLKRYLQEGL